MIFKWETNILYIRKIYLINGHISALESILNNSENILTFNLGTGKGTSVLEMIKVFEKVNNLKINYRFVNRRDGDCAVLVANCDLIYEKLNWKSMKTIEDICKDGWEWKIKNFINN